MEYSFFVTNVVKHVVVPDFCPILSKKNSGRFRGGADTKKPEKARKIKKIRRFVEPPILVRVFITDLIKNIEIPA